MPESRVSCEHAERCGGCPAIAVPYAEQLANKRGRVVSAITRYRSLERTYTEPTLGADPIVGYRTRAKLMVGPQGEVGLFAKGGGHVVLDVSGCRVLAPAIARVAATVRAKLRESRLVGRVRSVDLREVVSGGAEPRVLVTFVVSRANADVVDALTEEASAMLASSREILGAAVNFCDDGAVQVLGPETRLLVGEGRAIDEVGRSTTIATFGSFVQVHRGQAARVHDLVTRALFPATPEVHGTKPVRVLDLFGGSGAIGIALALAGAEVHLVEGFAPAVGAALEGARRARVTLTVECSDVTTALRGFLARGAQVDVIVANPPRRGITPEARELMTRVGARRIVYVSCDPETLARDLDHFARRGYAPGSIQPLDMIPLTDEVETVAVLAAGPAPKPIVQWEDDEVLILDKGPHEPTTPQGEYATSLLARARLLAPDATPVYWLDVGTSGLVIFAKNPAVVARWQSALAAESTRKIYLAVARGVTQAKGAIARELREDGKLLAARTRYRRLAVAGGHSVLRVVPEQGRTHQIRRHLAAIGHQVLGDDRYGHFPTNRFFEEKHALDRVFLHCLRLEIDHPLTGWRLVVESPVPGDLRTVLERMAGTSTLRFLEQKNALGAGGVSSLPPEPVE